MQFQVDLGRTNKFTRYSDSKKEFRCISALLDETDLGSHEVKIKVIFTSPKRDVLVRRRNFFIKVVDPTVIVDEEEK